MAAAACVAEAVRRIGLPSPAEVDVSRSPLLPGTAALGAYPRFPIDPRRPQRILVHASLAFRRPVLGPVLVGAGRYHGLGLCVPVDDDDDDDA
jgi:CRISPR-associated protein Csb2